VDRQQRIEQVSEPDAVRLRNEPEQPSIAVEAPRPASSHNLEGRLAISKQNLRADMADAALIDDLQHVGAVPLRADKLHRSVGHDPAHKRAHGEVFQFRHRVPFEFV
jgi:hypothetical protein